MHLHHITLKIFGLSSASFGIGTWLSNDFRSTSSGGLQKSRALNIVIKLASVNGKLCVKISDELSKACISGCSSIDNYAD